MTYEEFKAMIIRFFEEHPITIQVDSYHSEGSQIDKDGNIEINLSWYFDD